MSEIEKCGSPNCSKNFSVSEIGVKAPGGKESEDIRCPYCGYTISRRSTGCFKTHELPKEQQ